MVWKVVCCSVPYRSVSKYSLDMKWPHASPKIFKQQKKAVMTADQHP